MSSYGLFVFIAIAGVAAYIMRDTIKELLLDVKDDMKVKQKQNKEIKKVYNDELYKQRLIQAKIDATDKAQRVTSSTKRRSSADKDKSNDMLSTDGLVELNKVDLNLFGK